MRKKDEISAVVLSSDATGLATIRSLKKINVYCAAIVNDTSDIALQSRLPKEVIVICKTLPVFDAILKAIEPYSYKNNVLFFTSDHFLLFAASNYEYLSVRFRLFMTKAAIVQQLVDKRSETKLSESLGVDVPRSKSRLKPDAKWILDVLTLPIIFKPRTHYNNVLSKKNIVAYTADDVDNFVSCHGDHINQVVAQEVIPRGEGCLWICSCIFDADHSRVSIFMFKRLSSSPKNFGVTSLAVSEFNEELTLLVEKVGRTLNLVGPADIEFKLDPRDRRYKFIEVNPRIGMCMYFDTACGVNNVANLYYLALDERVPLTIAGEQDGGGVFVSLRGGLYAKYKNGDSYRSVMLGYLKLAMRRKVFLYFSWNDPLPSLVYVARFIKEVFESRAQK